MNRYIDAELIEKYKRAFGRVYRPMRIRELTSQYKVGEQG